MKLRYADPEDLAEQLAALRSDAGASDATGAARQAGLRDLPFEVAADVPTHSLVVRGPPETIGAVLDVVTELDRVPASVRVEITVAAVDLDGRLDLGVDYLIPLTNPKEPDDLVAAVLVNPSGGGLNAIDPPPSADLPFVATFTKDPLLIPIVDSVTGVTTVIPIPRGGSITMNERVVHTDLMMRPQLFITSGEEHEIFAGDNVPIPVAAPETPGPEPHRNRDSRNGEPRKPGRARPRPRTGSGTRRSRRNRKPAGRARGRRPAPGRT